METSVKKIENSQIELTVSLGKEDLFSYVEEAEKKLAQEAKLEGFRPGKAPKEMIRKQLGEAKIREIAMDLAVHASLDKALAEKNLDIIEHTDFKIVENSAEKLIYKVDLLVLPEIKLGIYKNLGIKKNPIVVSEAEIGNVIGDILKSRTILKEVSRPAQKGDRVEVDFIIKDGDAIIEGGKSENHPTVLGEGKFVPGFEEQIIGMKSGEKKNFTLKIPPDYYQKSISGKNLDFEVTLKRAEEQTLPYLTDDFAKSLGQFSSVKELEANVKQGLTSEKEAKEKDRLRLAMLEKIAETTKVEASKVLIDRRLDAMIQDFDNNLHQQGMELGLYLAHLKKTQDDLKREWRVKAESQVRLSFIAGAIAKSEHLEVSDEEIAAEMQNVLQEYMMSGASGEGGGQEALENINPEKMRGKIHDLLLNEKVFEFLEKNNGKNA
jgi:trigger factor